MFRSAWSFLFMLTLAALLAACSPVQANPTPAANLANPASVFCEQQGGKLDFRSDATGVVSGFCVFPDGSECDEWAFFRGECHPAGTSVTPDPTATPLAGDPAWTIYHNADFGYLHYYPTEAEIVMNADPLQGFTILGPENNSENWPMIGVSHPRDREDFRPPEDANLLQWLTDHNLIGSDREPDAVIAGTVALHFRHERSPQSYAFDTYYFAHAGQLFQIVINHTGDKEDWGLYNQFLAGFRFE